MSKTPPDADRLIQDVLAELGWSADASAIADRVRRLDVGLPCEDEFSVVCAWLGNCALLHKLDQQQVPVGSRSEFQVPDLLAMFTTQSTKSPVLIEVKSNKSKTLSLSPQYLRKLTNYAALLNLPLLIAWKFHGIWMLIEARHLKRADKNFNISLSDAMKENLLGVLAGDVAYKIGAGAGVHFGIRKDELLSESDDGKTQQWRMVIDDVSFTDYDGNSRKDLSGEVQSLFTTWDLEEKEEHTDTHIKLGFVAGSEGMLFAHMALVRLLNWESPHDQGPNWRHLLRRERVTANVANFSAALETALHERVVYNVFNVEPHSMPDFLPPR